MRRRTAKLELTLLLAAAAALGCGPRQQRRCADGEGRPADDLHCEHPAVAGADWSSSNGADGGPAAPVPAGGGYHWVYLARPWYGWGWGRSWYGGSGWYGGSTGFRSSGGEAGVTRGGFGGTGEAHAGAGHAGAAGHGSGT
ncbi:MAG TPA: hypothetical protein VFE30_06320 [Anaeromyxobacteraceae bacterium]|nr:hypothetical protein [Anaeromyxobacteraceae bacterium]